MSATLIAFYFISKMLLKNRKNLVTDADLVGQVVFQIFARTYCCAILLKDDVKRMAYEIIPRYRIFFFFFELSNSVPNRPDLKDFGQGIAEFFYYFRFFYNTPEL